MADAVSAPLSLKTFGRRVLLAALGLFLFAFGIYTQLAAGVGTSPWNVLTDGLAQMSGLTFGRASILISLVIVALDLLLGEPMGLGTLMDVFLIGWWVDLFVWLDCIPTPATLWGKLLLLMLGVFAICFGQYLYIGAGLSCGPRDALLVAVGKRVPKTPIGLVNIALMALALAGGWIMGGLIGFGTILTMFCMGLCMDLVFHLMHFEPRLVPQQSLLHTWTELRAILTQSQGDQMP